MIGPTNTRPDQTATFRGQHHTHTKAHTGDENEARGDTPQRTQAQQHEANRDAATSAEYTEATRGSQEPTEPQRPEPRQTYWLRIGKVRFAHAQAIRCVAREVAP